MLNELLRLGSQVAIAPEPSWMYYPFILSLLNCPSSLFALNQVGINPRFTFERTLKAHATAAIQQ
jgi:hypothetical protein